jgi:hypothetical protein
MSAVSKEIVREFLKDYLTQNRRPSGVILPVDLTDNCDLLLTGVLGFRRF